MTKWPWLMIILTLISTVQWLNSTAQQTNDNNSNWKGYLRSSARNRPKRTRFFDQDTSSTLAISSSYKEDQKDEPVINIKHKNVRDLPPANLTKIFKKKISPIVFPNQLLSINKFVLDQQVVQTCSLNETFCVKVDNYPRQYASNLFRNSKYMSTSYFGNDTVTNEIQTRIANSNLEKFCESREEIIFPEAGVTKNNEWRYIIQDVIVNNTNYKQGIRVEKCISGPEAKCKFNGLLPLGYTTTCVQKFIYKKLVAIKDFKEIYYENFKLPSCCECMYSKPTDTSTNNDQKLTELTTC